MLWILGAVVLLALIWLRWRWVRVRQFWADRGVPHAPPHPLFGNLSFLSYQNPAVWFRKQYEHHAAPYFGMWLLWTPALVVQSPELARRVLIKDSEVFRDRFVASGSSDPIGSLNLFTVNDPLWSSVRRRLTMVFTAAKLRAIQPLVTKKSNELMQRIRRDYVNGQNSDKQDLRELVADLTTDIISVAAFGLAGEATLTGDSPMRAVTRDFSSYSLHRTTCIKSIFFAPYLVDFFRFSFFPKSTTRFFTEVFSRAVAQRGGWEANVGEKRDLLDALIRLRQEALADGEVITEDMVLAQAAILLQGGFDTTAVAMAFTIYELAYNRPVQEKLYAELIEAKHKAGGELSPNILAELPYLSAVFKESLRKYPAMGWLDRVAKYDYPVDDKVTIPRGTPVYVNALGMHYAPEYFPDPLKYDPGRFMPENESNIIPFTYMPFGDGPRNCIGMRFAQQTVRTLLSEFVLTFEFRPLPGAPLPRDVGIDSRSLFLGPNCRLAVHFAPRT